MKKAIYFSLILLFATGAKAQQITVVKNILPLADSIHFAAEKHFANVQQLTFGGDNAEAYFSFDGKWLIFQRTNPKDGIMCDQMFIGKVPTQPGEKFEPYPVSSGKGRTTCGSFLKDGKHIIYASTHVSADTCLCWWLVALWFFHQHQP